MGDSAGLAVMAEIAQCGSRSFRAELKSVPEIFRNQNSLTSYNNNDILMLSKEKRYFCKKCKGERYVQNSECQFV